MRDSFGLRQVDWDVCKLGGRVMRHTPARGESTLRMTDPRAIAAHLALNPTATVVWMTDDLGTPYACVTTHRNTGRGRPKPRVARVLPVPVKPVESPAQNEHLKPHEHKLTITPNIAHAMAYRPGFGG